MELGISELSLTSDLSVYPDRWKHLHDLGVIRAVDKGIVALKALSEKYPQSNRSKKRDILDDIEWNTAAISRPIAQILALEDGRTVNLPLSMGEILTKATEQYLVYLDPKARRAIHNGARSGIMLVNRETSNSELNNLEREYHDWALVRLCRHLVYTYNLMSEHQVLKTVLV